MDKKKEMETGGKGPDAKLVEGRPRLFRKVDWVTFGVVTLISLVAYLWTLAPDLTLEDSGELAVGSYYAGVPHPPGYPVWTLYTWAFTKILPFSNIAWRVAISSAVAAAFACGLLGLLISRGSSLLLEGLEEFKGIERRWEDGTCFVAGLAGGLLLAFNGFMWSQAVIVEVYTLSVLSFLGVLCFLFRWIYAPEQRRYLYLAAFMFGICFTNHQTLIVATMGIELAVLLAHPRLGRDLFLANSIIYLLGLYAKATGAITTFDQNMPLFAIYNIIGVGSIVVFAVTAYLTPPSTMNLFGTRIRSYVLTEWKPLLVAALMWILGAMFYFYMPIASMTNPPMNWGYPRTVEGFAHALTRGQYDKTNPTTEVGRFVDQVVMYVEGATNEFNLVYLLIGLLPFFFLSRMRRREQAWLIGLAATYLFLSVLLLVLLNPNTDKQSSEQVRVFFTSSHIVIAMAIGYGVSLISGLVAIHYERVRGSLVWAGAAAVGVELYYVAKTFDDTEFALLRSAALLGLVLAAVFTGLVLLRRKRLPAVALLVLFALMPVRSILSNWADNEQRGHLFGYWFGHDMFTPPFGIYPEMAEEAILFGGTDPGRFNPTYMIFCESFIPPEKKRDPDFDRRDVYIITQNALADGTYLSYIRAHYNRSTQIDPPFFTELFRTEEDRRTGRTNAFARMFAPADRFFTKLGANIEEARRERGVYPAKEIHTPSVADSQQAFHRYMADAQQRLYENKLKPGEDVRIQGGRVQVSGQVAVMAINGLLTELIFDRNPGHEFYLEESFPLEWMFPHLTPFGIIMKINREPVKELTPEMVARDHEFWSRYSERLIGNWITYDTSIEEICQFAERTYKRRDFEGFQGDPKFVRDTFAQKAFSKLRSAIAGVYTWRLSPECPDELRPAPGEPQQRMLREAEFALKQSFAFCPQSPEAVYKLVSLLAGVNRVSEAARVVETSLLFDPQNAALASLAAQLRGMQQQQQLQQGGQAALQTPAGLPAAPEVAPSPDLNLTNVETRLQMVDAYIRAQQTNLAKQMIDQVRAQSGGDVQTLLSLAQFAAQLADGVRLNQIIQSIQQEVKPLETRYEAEPGNVPLAFQLVSAYLITQMTNEAAALLDKLVAKPEADASTLLSAAHAYNQLQMAGKMEDALQRLVQIIPNNPEAWYDLATVQAARDREDQVLASLSRAIALSEARLQHQPAAQDLRARAATDPSFQKYHHLPEFQSLVRQAGQ